MKAFDLQNRQRWLFAMTHPDDEISICAFIRRLTKAGHEVYMSWTHSTPVREQEARRAATEWLGVPNENLYFFGATDQSVCHEIEDLLGPFASMIAKVQPERICCGAFEQGHIDHDSTNLIVNLSFDGPVFEIPFYFPYTTRAPIMNRFAASGSSDERLELTSEESRFKKDFAKQFPSQAIWRNLLAYEILQGAKLAPIELSKRELMRLQTHRNFLEPNLPEPYRSRVLAHPTWGRWHQAVSPFLSSSGTLLTNV